MDSENGTLFDNGPIREQFLVRRQYKFSHNSDQ